MLKKIFLERVVSLNIFFIANPVAVPKARTERRTSATVTYINIIIIPSLKHSDP